MAQYLDRYGNFTDVKPSKQKDLKPLQEHHIRKEEARKRAREDDKRDSRLDEHEDRLNLSEFGIHETTSSYDNFPTSGSTSFGGGGGGGGLPYWAVTRASDTTVDIGEGYGCYAGVLSANLAKTGYGAFSTNGTFYICAKLDLSASPGSAWSIVVLTYVTSFKNTIDTANTDPLQHYVIAKVVVADNIIESITQAFNQWIIYENRS